jgi:dTDP-4-amino-4,6-dideoxygalactose transaminase
MYVPFHRPSIGDDEINAVVASLKSGWLTMGPATFEFERIFAEYTGAAHAVAFNSCTAALHAALVVAGIGPGDEVIVPALTFVASAEVVCYTGAFPVLADVDPSTWCISIDEIRRIVTPRTKAVIVVHYGGHPADMGPIRSFCAERGIEVIEDAAHALPASYQGDLIGSSANPVAFSFYATKTITTGEGGMLTFGDAARADAARRIRLHGIDRDAWNRYSRGGKWQYDVTALGYKYNPTDLASSLGIAQLRSADAMNAARRQIAARYTERFRHCSFLKLYREASWATSAWHLYPVRLADTDVHRDTIIEELTTAGVGTSVHYIPLYRFTYYQSLYSSAGRPLDPESFPVCEALFGSMFSLPIYPALTEAEMDFVMDTVERVIGSRIA